MIKKLILILLIIFMLDYVINVFLVDTKSVKYEYKGKYKDENKERIVEHIGEKKQ